MPKEKAPEKETKLLSKKEEKRLRKLRVSVRSRARAPRFTPASPLGTVPDLAIPRDRARASRPPPARASTLSPRL